jgi:DNA-binding NtrC family response regulator
MAHVLIIDDDDEVRGVLARILHRDGHKTSEARDGREGVAVQAADNADVVITDIVMPEMEGLETISTLLRASPELPIIAMSGVTNARLYLAASRNFGAKFTLGKPIAPHVLSQTVKRALSPSSEERSGASE